MGYLPGAAGGARDLMQKFKKSCVDDDPGLTFPSHLGPYGYASAIGPSPNGDQRIRWNGEFAASVLLWDWEYILRGILVYQPKDLNRDWSPRFSTLRDKNGWVRAKTA
jgi:hypothetical protein